MLLYPNVVHLLRALIFCILLSHVHNSIYSLLQEYLKTTTTTPLTTIPLFYLVLPAFLTPFYIM